MLHKIKDFLLYSELNVSLVALGLGNLAALLIGQKLQGGLLLFLGAASFCFYSLERNLTLPSLANSIFPEKSRWIYEHSRLNFGLIALSGVVTGISFFYLGGLSQVGILFFGALALTYSITPFPILKKPLKDYPIAKAGLLVTTWVFLTLLLPILETTAPTPALFAGLVVLWCLWIFSNAVFFDIRDLEIDFMASKKTLAMQLGRTKAHYWVSGLVVFQLATIFVISYVTQALGLFWVLASSGFALLLLNHYFKTHRNTGLPFFIAADLTLVLPVLLLQGLPTF